MKKLILGGFLFLAGCGSGGSGNSAVNSTPVLDPPTILNLQISPQSATLNEGGTHVLVSGTVTITDPEFSNTRYLYVKSLDPNGNIIQSIKNILEGGGIVANTKAQIQINMPTTTRGNLSILVYLENPASALTSNFLTTPFPIN
ncbi:MAG: hypothetical protein FD174_2616 [Geobacteraceae bacterium]|nr:MAG: hypothetical protein FD174_2616 [Geobacteraceae bacterium]